DSPAARLRLDRLQVRSLVHADLSGHHRTHARFTPVCLPRVHSSDIGPQPALTPVPALLKFLAQLSQTRFRKKESPEISWPENRPASGGKRTRNSRTSTAPS